MPNYSSFNYSGANYSGGAATNDATLRSRRDDMVSILPWWIKASPVLNRLLAVYGGELDSYGIWSDDVVAQMFVRRATWGLEYWEDEMGLPYGGNMTDQARADRIVARLRSFRQSTPFVIRLIANSFENGAVLPIEDFANRKLIIRFQDIRGVPQSIEDLSDALDRVVRASALLVFEYTFLTWGELKAHGNTWQSLKTAGVTWSQLKTMRPEQLP